MSILGYSYIPKNAPKNCWLLSCLKISSSKQNSCGEGRWGLHVHRYALEMGKVTEKTVIFFFSKMLTATGYSSQHSMVPEKEIENRKKIVQEGTIDNF